MALPGCPSPRRCINLLLFPTCHPTTLTTLVPFAPPHALPAPPLPVTYRVEQAREDEARDFGNVFVRTASQGRAPGGPGGGPGPVFNGSSGSVLSPTGGGLSPGAGGGGSSLAALASPGGSGLSLLPPPQQQQLGPSGGGRIPGLRKQSSMASIGTGDGDGPPSPARRVTLASTRGPHTPHAALTPTTTGRGGAVAVGAAVGADGRPISPSLPSPSALLAAGSDGGYPSSFFCSVGR